MWRSLGSRLLPLLVVLAGAAADGRWSRQIQNQGFSPAAINDWIPLNLPCPTCRQSDSARESGGRVLSHPSSLSQNTIQTGPQVFNSIENQPQQQFSFGPETFQSQPPRFGLPPQSQAPQLPQAQHLIQSPLQNIQQPPEAFQLHQHPANQHRLISHPQHFTMRMPHHQMHLRPHTHHHPHPHIHQQPINFSPQQFVLGSQPQHHQPPQFFEHQPIPPFVHLPAAPQPLQQQPEPLQYIQLSSKSNQFNDPHMFQRQQELNFNHHQNVNQHHMEISNRPQTSELVQHKPTKNALQHDEKFLGQHKFNVKPQPQPNYQIFQQEPPQQIQHNHPKPAQPIQLGPQPNQTPPEEVQLVYVPLETLYPQQQQQQQQNTGPNTFNLPDVNPGFINTLYDSERKPQFEQKFTTTPRATTTTSTARPTTYRTTTTNTPRPTTTPRQTISVTQRSEYFRTSTTPKPNKPKTHQPPLAMFMLKDKYNGRISENDVISTLSGAQAIDVIDTPSKKMPKVFIGPYGLDTPEGYSKFDLPYLSSIDQHRFDRQAESLPFFVAPHSFKTPNGFNKISLPSPHVGAVLVKYPQEPFTTSYQPSNLEYFPNPSTAIRSSTPQYSSSSSSQAPRDYSDRFTYSHDHQYSTSTPNNIYSTVKVSTPNPQRPSTRHQEPISERPRDEIIRGRRPQYEYEGLRDTTMSKVRVNENKPAQRVPERKYPTNTYVQMQPSVTRDDDDTYITEPTPVRSTYQTARPTQSTKAQEEYQMKNFFREQDSYKIRQQTSSTTERPVQHHSEVTSRPTESSSQSAPHRNRFSLTSDNDDFNQNRFNFNPFNGVPTPHTTAQPEPVAYTREPSHHSSHTPRVHNFKLVDSVTVGPTTPSYSSLQLESSSVSSVTPDATFPESQRHGHRVVDTQPIHHQHLSETSVPLNHKPNYQQQEYPVTEQIQTLPDAILQQSFDQYIPQQPQYVSTEANRDEQSVEQDYNLSPDMPTINPFLPGMINSLMDMKDDDEPETTTQQTIRRPPSVRPRRPIPSVYTTQSTVPTTYQPETTTRKPITRGRRPNYNVRGTTTTNGNYQSTTTRSTSVRNPNRVRFNPSPEERQRFNARGRTKTAAGSKPKEEDNIEYQRDVLNQNYPVIKAYVDQSAQDYTATTASSSQNYNRDNPSTESTIFGQQDFNQINIPQQSALQDSDDHLMVYHNGESQKQQPFNGLQEPMQIPENQNEVSNYPPVYYSRDPITQEPDRATVPVSNTVNVRPIYIPSTRATPISRTTTTEEPTTVEPHKLRRPSFVKRPLRPNTYTTQSPATTTNSDGEERFTVRSRSRQSVTTSQPPRIVKYRGRTRKPTVPSATETTSNENSYRGYNNHRRANTTSTEDYGTEAPVTSRYSSSERIQNRPKYRPQGGRSRFALEAQESQWSQSFNENSFQPSDFKVVDEKSPKNVNFDKSAEPEIVTVANDQEEGSFLLTVSHGLGENQTNVEPTLLPNENLNATSTSVETTQNTTRPASFVDMFEEFMSDYSHETPKKPAEQQVESGDIDESSESKNVSTEEEKTSSETKQGKRRGIWRRVRVRPADGLETAESQNIRSNFYNSLQAEPQKDLTSTFNEYEKNNLEKIEESFLHEDVTTIVPESINTSSDVEEHKQIESTFVPVLDDVVGTTEITVPETTDVDKEFVTLAPEVIGETTVMPPHDSKTKLNVTESKEMITDRSFSLYDEYDYDTNANAMSVDDHEDDPITTIPSDTLGERSIFDEVKQKLTDLFAIPEDEDEDRIPINNYRSQYMDSHQIRGNYNSIPTDDSETTPLYTTTTTTTTTTTPSPPPLPLSTEPTKPDLEETLFSKNPLGNLIYATSTSTEISHETEICFRGRCIKTAEKSGKKKKN